MLVEAAERLLSREETFSMSLEDILAEADLSTRAFYRHFESKEVLLEALMLREAEAFGRLLRRAATRAPSPVAALEAWLSCYLDVFVQPQRFKRATIFSTTAFNSSRPSAQLMREMRRIACEPLVEVLANGHETGVLYSPTPEEDAYSIHDLVGASNHALALFASGASSNDNKPFDRDATWAHVVRFAWPALQLES